ncbi:MAG: hypothetical protein ACM3XN_10085 [Chloroflexota bacterium]
MNKLINRLRTWLRDLPVRLKGMLQRLDRLAVVLLYLCLLVLLPSVILEWEPGVVAAIALGLFFACNFLTLGALDLAIGRHQQAVRRLRGGLEALSTRVRPVGHVARRAILRSTTTDADGGKHDYLNFVADGNQAVDAELFAARVVIPNSGMQDRRLRIGDADAAPATEGIIGLRLSLAVFPDASGRRLWLDQAKAGSVEEPRAVLVDGAPRADCGQFNYVIVGTVSGELRHPVWSNALMADVCRRDKKAAARIDRLRIEWERSNRQRVGGGPGAGDSTPHAGIFAIRSPFQTAWDSGKVVVIAVGESEAELERAIARAFAGGSAVNRVDITVAQRSRWQQMQQSATERAPGVIAALLTVGAGLVRSFFPGAVLALLGSIATYTPKLTIMHVAASGLGLLTGVGWHAIQEYGRLRGLMGSAYTVYDEIAARVHWGEGQASRHRALDPVAASETAATWLGPVNSTVGGRQGPQTIAEFIRSLRTCDAPPLIVTGNNFHFQTGPAEHDCPRSLLGMPIRIDTIDLILVAELLAALGLDHDESSLRIARLDDIVGEGARTLCLTRSELTTRDLIVLGSPRSNVLANCLFRCGVDYQSIKWGFMPIGQCPHEERCDLRTALEAYHDVRGRSLLAPWAFEPEQISVYDGGERVASFGFPWHDNAGLIQLVDNPYAPGRKILMAHGYHRAGSDAAVATLVAAARGEGLPALSASASLVVEYSGKERRIECLFSR